ncbi:hypothetical protein NRP93_003466 [Clostridium botulinum]|nr:hypothetical protein [Clostridium botulinum]
MKKLNEKELLNVNAGGVGSFILEYVAGKALDYTIEHRLLPKHRWRGAGGTY